MLYLLLSLLSNHNVVMAMEDKMTDGVTKGLTFEQFCEKMESRGLNVKGQEVPDPVPFKPIVKVGRQPSMFDIHRAQVAQMRAQAAMDGDETPEEMLDFGPDTDDDIIERLSEYEQADLDIVLAQIEARRKASESVPTPSAPSSGERDRDRAGEEQADLVAAPVDPAKAGK